MPLFPAKMLIFAHGKPFLNMKEYLLEAVVAGIIYCIGLVVLDAKPGREFQSVWFYLISAVVFGLLFAWVMRLIQKRIGKKKDK